ncbi:MAG: hypothetical protein V8Q40_06105 [Anaerosacchariphilus sp.]
MRRRAISDSARYRALGNSIALPCAEYVMAGIYESLQYGTLQIREYSRRFPVKLFTNTLIECIMKMR